MAKLPSVTDLEKMLRNGWTYDDIAVEFGVQRWSVWRKLQRAGKRGNKKTSKDFLPWEVLPEHQTTNVYRNLTALWRIDHGEKVGERSRAAAERFRKRLEQADAVVGYDPRIGPNPASERHGGFFYAARRDGDFTYTRNPDL